MPGMISMLATIIFIPILAVEVFSRFAPRLANNLLKRQFPISLILLPLSTSEFFIVTLLFSKKDHIPLS
jgi:hypothetical protein